MSTFEKVKKVVVDQLSCDEALVTPEASFTADLGADSLDTVELVMALKKNSDAKFLMKKLKKFKLFKMQLTTSIHTHSKI